MALEDRAEDRQPGGEGTKKKPFEPPRLYVYGDIATLTRAVGNTGSKDGSGNKRSQV